jgi:Antitoxin-like ribbon-helix-helix
MIGGHFDPAVKSSLKLIQAKHPQLTTQLLLEEALDLLFERHKVPQAARVR